MLLAQQVKESDLFFRVKRQIKTVLTNVEVEHVKSRMSNGKSAFHIKQARIYWCANVMMEILLILYTSPYHVYKSVLIAKNK